MRSIDRLSATTSRIEIRNILDHLAMQIYQKKRLSLCILFASIACLPLPWEGTNQPQQALGEDWKQFLGPTANAILSASSVKSLQSLPTTWSPDKGVKWYTEVDGLGWSSPIVVDGRIFITAAAQIQDGESKEGSDRQALTGSQSLSLHALDIKTGKIEYSKVLLQQPADAPEIHGKNSHASPTIVSDGKRLFIHFGHMGTLATDLDGNELWRNTDHMYPPRHGNGGSPILVDNLVIVTCDGNDDPYTLALDQNDGHEVWKVPRGVDAERKFSFCTPTIIEHQGRRQIISPGSDIVQSLDPSTGKVLWSVKYSGFSVVPKPLYYADLIFICTGFGETTLLAIDPSGIGDVTDSHVQWTYKSPAVPQTPSVLAYEDQIIVVGDSGICAGVSIDHGKELWKKRIGGNYSASPLLVGPRIYFQSEQGEGSLYEIEPNHKGLKQLEKSELPGRIFASYAICESDLIIRSEKGVYRIYNE
jgi:outer membrane protein assembly factor BamB